ncbi:MAG: acetyl-CoA carboxylase carboxyl transferase subunit alpha, partial [Abditibacteriota bacterium]|nr:acetyl-CoA carboxylase carboxyl transferase subunit alpha [Abditibacteriota bacterium]
MAEKWNVLDFEKPIETLEEQISQIKRLAAERGEDRAAEIAELENDRNRLIATVFSNLTPWDVVLIARHPKRPYTLDYVNMMMTDVVMLHGDRLCADDKAMVGGL